MEQYMLLRKKLKAGDYFEYLASLTGFDEINFQDVSFL
jgi:hypothetical protein